MRAPVGPVQALQRHWPEYLIEAWALAMFMVSASLFTIWLEQPHMPLRLAIENSDGRRALIGLAMGATAIGLIYSPWGRRSGAHMNPAVTVAFLSLQRIAPWDAVFYIVAQFVGGYAGVLLVWRIYGTELSSPPVSFIATVPGLGGPVAAFLAELLISAVTMTVILHVSDYAKLARYTGLAAGFLIASYVTFEAPISGFSMNPARTLASALPGERWNFLWIYFTAPLLGMCAAAGLYRVQHRGQPTGSSCAKLQHSATVPCIHCGLKHT